MIRRFIRDLCIAYRRRRWRRSRILIAGETLRLGDVITIDDDFLARHARADLHPSNIVGIAWRHIEKGQVVQMLNRGAFVVRGEKLVFASYDPPGDDVGIVSLPDGTYYVGGRRDRFSE